MADAYLSTLQPWRDTLKMGLTTWAETPEPTRSDSHAWSAHPNFDLLRVVAGIRPGAPQFSEIVIEPHLGNLQSLSAAMPHPKGSVEVSYSPEMGSGTSAKIRVPEGVPARLIWKGRTYTCVRGNRHSSCRDGRTLTANQKQFSWLILARGVPQYSEPKMNKRSFLKLCSALMGSQSLAPLLAWPLAQKCYPCLRYVLSPMSPGRIP
jgi:hypothetical protein